MTVRFRVDPWDPSYGASIEPDLAPASAEVNPDVEIPASAWGPRSAPPLAEPRAVVFVDGVQRIEARVWIDGSGAADPGVVASFAAGAVRCAEGRASLLLVEVGRGVWSACPQVSDITTRHGTFAARVAAGSSQEQLWLALHEARNDAEVRVAGEARARHPDDLLVVDGPLRGRTSLRGLVGLIKSHHIRYLPPGLDSVVGELRPGQRTPVFTTRSTWSRHSWYLRLPGGDNAPWVGVVRCEAPAELSPEEVVALADQVAAILPRYASQPHKDARAPQNLTPIGGLERELRRRLGDQALLYRALRRAAAVA